jgi:Phosphoglycerate mutase family.
MRLIFVRHGHPDYINDCLTELGRIQAKQAAERLKGEGIEKIYSSPCGRAYETAAYTASMLNLDIIKLDFMREISWGSIDGTPIYADGHPWNVADSALLGGVDFFSKTDEEKIWKNNIVAYEKEKVCKSFDEWLENLGYRRERNLYRVVGNDTDKSVALFSHGGSSTAVLSHLLDLPFAYLLTRLCPDFTAITILNFGNQKDELVIPRIEIANDTRHIKSGGITYGR